jgi:hypothetical protein
VPYPFGIGAGCHLEHPSFNLTCDTTTGWEPPRLLLSDEDAGDDASAQIVSISLDASTVMLRRDSWAIYIPSEDRRPGIRFLLDQLREWVLVSSVMLVPNETRAGDATCPHDMGTAACHSTHSTCHAASVDINKMVGYVCRCDDGYQGNPYLSDGCRGTYVILFSVNMCIQINKSIELRQNSLYYCVFL